MKTSGIVILLILSFGLFAKAEACGYYIAPHDPGGTSCQLAGFDSGQICVQGKCRSMVSNVASTVLVPYKTLAEWTSFYSSANAAFTVSEFCGGYGTDGVACAADSAIGCEYYYDWISFEWRCGTCVDAGSC